MNSNLSLSLPEINQVDFHDDFEDFFEHAQCGYLKVSANGEIIRANNRMAIWMGCSGSDLAGKNFADLICEEYKTAYETQLSSLLSPHGSFQEVLLQVPSPDKQQLLVLVTAQARRDKNGVPVLVRLTVHKETSGRIYQQMLQKEKTSMENTLIDERAVSALREQFIAVLGHDLRNPLAAITTGASVLAATIHNVQEKKIIATMQNSARRIAEMIENIMDFARGRLGGGMIVEKKAVCIAPILLHVVNELRAAFPQRDIQTNFNVAASVECDAPRISQLLSNLLANALTHGSDKAPVFVSAYHTNEAFELSVANSGQAIPSAALKNLFSPFTREAARPSQNGLGLGLYIAAEIARAHHGKLLVVSDDKETCFTFRMALAQ
jgi:phosphoserine phosphatase RsbU/P